MDETSETPTDPQELPARSTSPLIAAVACSLCVLVLGAGSFLLVYDRLLKRVNQEAARIDASVAALTSRVNVLEAQTTQLASAPKPDLSPLDTLSSGLATTSNKLGELSTRLEALEKKQPTAPAAEPAPAPAPAPVPQPAAAAPAAPSDDALRSQLIALLATLPKTEVSLPSENRAGGLLDKINTRFAGFISIRKQGAAEDAYASLRNDAASAALPVLAHEIEALPGDARAPLEAWLSAYHTALRTHEHAAPTPSRID